LLAKPTQLNINLSSDRFAMFNKERDISVASIKLAMPRFEEQFKQSFRQFGHPYSALI
jgi:hypothetical protein